MVKEVKLSITRSWVQNPSLPDERLNRKTSCRVVFYKRSFSKSSSLPLYIVLKLVSSEDSS